MNDLDRGTGQAVLGRHRRVVHKRAAPVRAVQLDDLLVRVLGQADRPLSAYDLASSLREAGYGAAIVTIYRALDRLAGRKLIQKVETLSAYRIRDKPDGVLIICVDCGQTRSIAVPAQHHALMQIIKGQGFASADLALEATGRCASCQGEVIGPDE